MSGLDVKIKRARVQLLLRYPFYASIILRRELKEDPTCLTAWTDGETIGYNPTWLDRWNAEQITGLLAHEGSHIARKHHLRRKSRNPGRWNAATDHSINLHLLADQFQLPENGLHDSRYEGMSAEQVYHLLPEEPQECDKGDGGSGSPYDEIRDWPGKGPKAQSKSGHRPSASEIEAESKQIDQEIVQAATMAKKRGKLPADIEQIVETIKNPLIDWRHLLRNYVQASAKDDHTWRRPNRRFAWQNIYLPSLYSEKIGELVVAVDTSGSTWSFQAQFISEVASIAKELRPTRLHLLYCDSAVSAETYDNMDELTEFKPRGGGGTSFVPVFDWIEEQGINPVCTVYLTDMDGTFPDLAPSYPVIWVDCEGNYNAPFGDYVRLEA